MQQCRIVPQHWLAFLFFLCMSGKRKADLVTEASAFKQPSMIASFLFSSETHPDLPQGEKSLPHCCAALLQTCFAYLGVTT